MRFAPTAERTDVAANSLPVKREQGSVAVGTETVGAACHRSPRRRTEAPVRRARSPAGSRVALAITAAGWRSARNELADAGETLAGAETAHDCIRPLAPEDNEATDRCSAPSTVTAAPKPPTRYRSGRSPPSLPPD